MPECARKSKLMVAVVIADVATEGLYEFEWRKFSTSPERLNAGLRQMQLPCFRPRSFPLPALRASNRGAREGRTTSRMPERLVRRLVAEELRLSFVPEPEQRLWR